jgi:hypothetical protein
MREVPDVTPKIVYLPQDAHDYFRNLAPDMDLVQQRGESLGERLENLLTNELLDGADKAVVMNSDSPTLPKTFLIQAFDQLSATDVVLGPTLDGGYYLIGVKEPQPRILRDVEMSTPYVLRDTLELASEAGVTVSLLPEWYDVDTVEELHRLRNDISGLQNNSCACTRAWLQNYPRNVDG